MAHLLRSPFVYEFSVMDRCGLSNESINGMIVPLAQAQRLEELCLRTDIEIVKTGRPGRPESRSGVLAVRNLGLKMTVRIFGYHF